MKRTKPEKYFQLVAWVGFIALLALPALLPAQTALAQARQELILRLSKDFGFSSTGRIQGLFSMRVTGPENLQKVVFYIDDQVIGEDSAAPFQLQFSTDSYSLGEHVLSAVGYTTNGQELRSNQITTFFVTSQQASQTTLKIMIPLLGLIFGIILLSALVPLLMRRGRNEALPAGTERKYGVGGGAICPRCGRPFPLHFAAPNISPVHKLERCPYCGKFGLMRRRSLKELRAAEAAELERLHEEGKSQQLTEEERLRRELDQSRYEEY